MNDDDEVPFQIHTEGIDIWLFAIEIEEQELLNQELELIGQAFGCQRIDCPNVHYRLVKIRKNPIECPDLLCSSRQ